MWRARYRIPRKLAARFFGRCETWIKRVQSGKYAPKDLHERILEALIRWSALEEIANGKPGGVEQIKRDIAAAESVCAAGHDAEAKAMIVASERRHGYPTDL